MRKIKKQEWTLALAAGVLAAGCVMRWDWLVLLPLLGCVLASGWLLFTCLFRNGESKAGQRKKGRILSSSMELISQRTGTVRLELKIAGEDGVVHSFSELYADGVKAILLCDSLGQAVTYSETERGITDPVLCRRSRGGWSVVICVGLFLLSLALLLAVLIFLLTGGKIDGISAFFDWVSDHTG